MNASEVYEELLKYKDDGTAYKMEMYMRNQFEFLGIPSPLRKELYKQLMKEKRKEKEIDWNFIYQCFGYKERELQYFGIDYLNDKKKALKVDDLVHCKALILSKSWWDSVDGIDQIVGIIVEKYNLYEEMIIWSTEDNIWLNRVSLTFQLQYKEKTNKEVLLECIRNTKHKKEFFVEKAIGWSLREYSKVNKEWVKQIVDEEELAHLSKKEASKYL